MTNEELQDRIKVIEENEVWLDRMIKEDEKWNTRFFLILSLFFMVLVAHRVVEFLLIWLCE